MGHVIYALIREAVMTPEDNQQPVSHILTNIGVVILLLGLTINPFLVNIPILYRRYKMGTLAWNGLRSFLFTIIYASINLKLKHLLRCFSWPWMFLWQCKASNHCLTCEIHSGIRQLLKQNLYFFVFTSAIFLPKRPL